MDYRLIRIERPLISTPDLYTVGLTPFYRSSCDLEIVLSIQKLPFDSVTTLVMRFYKHKTETYLITDTPEQLTAFHNDSIELPHWYEAIVQAKNNIRRLHPSKKEVRQLLFFIAETKVLDNQADFEIKWKMEYSDFIPCLSVLCMRKPSKNTARLNLIVR